MNIDPINEGLETQAFWAVIAQGVAAVEHLQASRVPPPPEIKAAISQPYRLSYVCQHCDSVHRVDGSYEQMSMAVQLLMLQGARSVLVETLTQALIRDAEEADEAVEAEPEGGAFINQRLQSQFFDRKSHD